MRLFVFTLLVFCSTLVARQAEAQQKVAIGAEIDYSVTVQHPVGTEGYDFFWSIDMGADKMTHADGPVGNNTISFKNYTVGPHSISVYMQRANIEAACPSNVQNLEIEVIEKPEIIITGKKNTDVCSYARVNEFTPITFNLDITGYVGDYSVEYDVIDQNGKVLYSEAAHGLNTENTEEENKIVVNQSNEDLFINNTKSNIDFKFKVTKIVFVRGDVSDDLDYDTLTQNITILPAVELGQIKF